MSEPGLPPPRSSPAAPSEPPSSPPASSASSTHEPPALHSDASNLSESEPLQFLVHSQQSVSNGETPKLSNGRPDKKARKRTSPQDQAILETEYKQNPKPDKVARLDIVKRVSLTEKEVQIWFQNRRQSTRRKSRPLLPHEIEAFGLGGMAALLATSTSSPSASSSSPTQAETTLHETNPPPPLHLSDSDGASSPSATQDMNLLPGETSHGGEDARATLDPTSSQTLPPAEDPTSFVFSQGSSQVHPSSLGYLSNRRHAQSNSFSGSFSLPAAAAAAAAAPHLARSESASAVDDSQATDQSSRVRLSLSLDGRAELVSGIPSPPRAETNSKIPRRSNKLRRSQSAIPLSFAGSLAPSMPHGRSRDSRSWELCCDSEARDELTTQAENESSGSAVAAISLIRSTSQSALKPNNNKRNAPPTTKRYSEKHGKKARLGRATSSVARMQSTDSRHDALDSHKPDPGTGLHRSPSGDSDKENLAPGDASLGHRRRPLPSSAPRRKLSVQSSRPTHQRRVLGDNNAVPTLAADLGLTKPKSRGANPFASLEAGNAPRLDIFDDDEEDVDDEDHDGPVDPEVQKFMRGEVSPSKKGDLDCIQGLLSLSQGNWR